MKDLSASVSGVALRRPSEVYAFLADFSGYPSWYPDGVKRAVLLDDSRGHTVLALNQGPIQRDFEMDMAIERVPETEITLRRLPKSPGDKEQLAVRWRLAPDVGDGRTAVTAQFTATLSIPGWLPLGGIEKAIPQGFLDAALARLNA
ncbi:MAG TPA: SRPBCC family protein [Solirubrobacteraceae bacterium]|nr:SRPBCC family protein [Solirubrobacteraceae bacterium]